MAPVLSFLFVVAHMAASSAPAPLVRSQPVVVPRANGSFDYMAADPQTRRLIVAHTGSDAVAFLSLDTGRLQRQLYIGTAHGIAIAVDQQRYFVGTSGAAHGIAVIDRRTLALERVISMPRPIDALAYDSRRALLYADEDKGDSIWVLGARSGRVVKVIRTPYDSDKIEYDRATDRVYQNFTTIDAMLVFDPATFAKVARWSTLPARRPHGLAVDPAGHAVYAAGTNGAVVRLDLRTGRMLSWVRVARHVDQIALDARRHRLYCASGDGFVSVVDTSEPALHDLADMRVPHGAHTVAVDPMTGAVWISFGTAHDDYVMKLVPAASARAQSR